MITVFFVQAVIPKYELDYDSGLDLISIELAICYIKEDRDFLDFK